MHWRCFPNAFEDGRAGGAAQLSHVSQGRGTWNAFGMHFKCIMVHMHSASYAYCPYALFPYAFEMHFKCIMAHMHSAPYAYCPMHYSRMHLKCISNAYGKKCIWGSSNALFLYAFEMHSKCIMAHMHSAPYA